MLLLAEGAQTAAVSACAPLVSLFFVLCFFPQFLSFLVSWFLGFAVFRPLSFSVFFSRLCSCRRRCSRVRPSASPSQRRLPDAFSAVLRCGSRYLQADSASFLCLSCCQSPSLEGRVEDEHSLLRVSLNRVLLDWRNLLLLLHLSPTRSLFPDTVTRRTALAREASQVNSPYLTSIVCMLVEGLVQDNTSRTDSNSSALLIPINLAGLVAVHQI